MEEMRNQKQFSIAVDKRVTIPKNINGTIIHNVQKPQFKDRYASINFRAFSESINEKKWYVLLELSLIRHFSSCRI